MKFLKTISIIIVIVFCFSFLSGCSLRKGHKKTMKEEVAMGRFVEDELGLPEGVKADNIINILKSPEGGMELYTSNYEANRYEKYDLKDGKWVADPKSSIKMKKSILFLEDFFYGEDKKLYFTGRNLEADSILSKITEEAAFEDITIPKFNREYEENGKKESYIASTVVVLENGMIAVAYTNHLIEIYSSDGQKTIVQLEGESVATEGNRLYYVDSNRKSICIYNLDEGKSEDSISLDNISYWIGSKMRVENGTIYICDSNGIHQRKQEGSIWETTVDGTSSRISLPSLLLTGFTPGNQEDYYTILADSTTRVNTTFLHYRYDETVPSTPSSQLVIYSLSDNPTIHQAAIEFQTSHPDTVVSFRVADTSGGAVTISDQIRTLNTEILAGKGPDLLVLEGLPVDSYKEKGILMDMGDLFEPMISSGELLENITDTYVEDGKVFAMPVRFKLPVIYGATDAVKAASSLEELGTYVEHTDLPLLTPSNYRALAEWFLLLNYDRIVEENNNVNTGQLQNYLENLNKISINIKASDDAKMGVMNTIKGQLRAYWIESMFDVASKKVLANVEEFNNIGNLGILLSVIKDIDGSYSTFQKYKTNGLIGINSKSKKKELAKEFVEFLFTPEIQNIKLEDGYPVNKSVLDDWITKEMESYQVHYGNEEQDITGSCPSEDQKKELLNMFYSLDKPIVSDRIIIDMIISEAEKYLKGDVTAALAADNAASGIKTYLSE